MLGFRPNQKMWERVNSQIMGENAAEVICTFIGAMCSMVIEAGVADNVAQARAHLAAILLSPDTAPKPGSLLPLLQTELAKLNDGGKWIQ